MHDIFALDYTYAITYDLSMMKTKTVTASEARADLYHLIDQASKGLTAVEIVSRGKEPVVMMSKTELDAWEETLDVLSSPNEMAAIRSGKKDIETGNGVLLEDLP